MWFEKLTGFREESAKQVRKNLSLNGSMMKSKINGKEFDCGQLETPSLEELRERINAEKIPLGKLSLHEVVADVQEIHVDTTNSNALFQVASQFNLLEMASPNAIPEHGVDRYEYDLTQGPACAIAAGAGTIYRNYFVKCNGQIGQTSNNQIDCLADIGKAFNNVNNRLWQMKNGYAFASMEGLIEIDNKLKSASESELDALRKLLRIGIQWNTEVTLDNARHTVTQAYCSALPVAYSQHPSELWARFAQLILEASYEATLCAAILNSLENNSNKVYLTLLGGGVFGNEEAWITKAIFRVLKLNKMRDLQVFIVSYGHSKPHIQKLIQEFNYDQ
jgi:hypothetical protein